MYTVKNGLLESPTVARVPANGPSPGPKEIYEQKGMPPAANSGTPTTFKDSTRPSLLCNQKAGALTMLPPGKLVVADGVMMYGRSMDGGADSLKMPRAMSPCRWTSLVMVPTHRTPLIS